MRSFIPINEVIHCRYRRATGKFDRGDFETCFDIKEFIKSFRMTPKPGGKAGVSKNVIGNRQCEMNNSALAFGMGIF